MFPGKVSLSINVSNLIICTQILQTNTALLFFSETLKILSEILHFRPIIHFGVYSFNFSTWKA